MRTGAASVEQLIAHGGWLVDDATARAAANPTTFLLPRPETVAQVIPGTMVRATFMVADQADPVIDEADPYGPDGRPTLVVGHERMWMWVLSLTGPATDPATEVIGILTNQPVATHTRLRPGAQVRVPLRQVIDVDLTPRADMRDELQAMTELGFPVVPEDEVAAPEDPTRLPSIDESQAAMAATHGVRPERPYPAPMVRVLLGRTLVPGSRPIFGGRGRPRADRGDAGWTIWSTYPDMHEASQTDGFDIVAITEVRERCPEVWPFLALPPGWAFVLAPDAIDVYQDPDLLD